MTPITLMTLSTRPYCSIQNTVAFWPKAVPGTIVVVVEMSFVRNLLHHE